MSTTFCLSVRTECASDDNTTRTDFSHYFRSLAEVVLNTLHLTYKQASKSITTHGWWAEVGLDGIHASNVRQFRSKEEYCRVAERQNPHLQHPKRLRFVRGLRPERVAPAGPQESEAGEV